MPPRGNGVAVGTGVAVEGRVLVAGGGDGSAAHAVSHQRLNINPIRRNRCRCVGRRRFMAGIIPALIASHAALPMIRSGMICLPVASFCHALASR